MSRKVNVNALLNTIKSTLDKLGATKALRKQVESLAKAAGADQPSDNKKTKKVSKKDEAKTAKKWRNTEAGKHSNKRVRNEDREEPRTKRVNGKKSEQVERKVRHTDDGNKNVVKHTRLRAVKVKKTGAAVETPSKVRENKKAAKSVKKSPKTAKPVAKSAKKSRK